MHRRLISIAIALSLSSAFAKDLPSPSKTQNTEIAQFSSATPESVGLDSAQLTKMLSYLQTPGFDMESIIIARHGKVLLEAYVAPFHAGIPHQVNSVTKSFMATLVGMLISDGKLKLTDTVADILPQYADLPNAKLITVEQLLGMKTGMLWKEDGDSADWAADWYFDPQKDWIPTFLKIPIEADLPGSFHYNSGGSDLLGILAEAALGSSLADYASQRLFKPLGIDNTRWVNRDQQGHLGGGRGLYIMPRDMLKLGELYRKNGEWQGKQILPASWVQYATSPIIPVSKGTHYYGAQWWVGNNREWFSALGARGQFIAVFPQDDITVVMTSRNQDRSNFGLSALREYYLKLKEPRTENPIAFAALQDKITQLATPTATSKLRSPLEKTINKRKIDLENPAFWANQLQFEFKDDVATITMVPRSINDAQPYIIPANLGEAWLHTPVTPINNRWQKSGPESMRAARAQWLDNNTLQFEALDVDEYYSANYKIKFNGKKATLLNMNDSVASQGILR
ncbi:serine hydrolase domain-containing protein [Deefgea rivuli]|uniref:serine hydrolase domain-containing protein n=1 Tax=Deefgea rivuli TaxID=400948 RepID=UPI0006846AC7|nr:serine hydrolase [Deefgea rivuli]